MDRLSDGASNKGQNVSEKGITRISAFLVFVALAALLALQLLVGRELVGAGDVLPVALRVPERKDVKRMTKNVLQDHDLLEH